MLLDTCARLIFIKKCELIGKLRVKAEEHNIYKIKEILVLPLTPPGSILADEASESLASVECDIDALRLLNVPPPPTSSSSSSLAAPAPPSPTTDSSHTALNSSHGSSSSLLEGGKPPPATSPASNSTNPNANPSNKMEKKLLEEVIKIFQDNQGSFYFSYTYDLTNSVERIQQQFEKGNNLESGDLLSYWRRTDDRFFWNKCLLADIINIASNFDSNDLLDCENNVNSNESCDKFLLPVIQGFAQIESFEYKLPAIIDSSSPTSSDVCKFKTQNGVELRIALISRRSRFRLGGIKKMFVSVSLF